jgi:hypothetical protein
MGKSPWDGPLKSGGQQRPARESPQTFIVSMASVTVPLRLVDDREEGGVRLVPEDDHCGFAAAWAITRAAASGESTSVLTTRS